MSEDIRILKPILQVKRDGNSCGGILIDGIPVACRSVSISAKFEVEKNLLEHHVDMEIYSTEFNVKFLGNSYGVELQKGVFLPVEIQRGPTLQDPTTDISFVATKYEEIE